MEMFQYIEIANGLSISRALASRKDIRDNPTSKSIHKEANKLKSDKITQYLFTTKMVTPR